MSYEARQARRWARRATDCGTRYLRSYQYHFLLYSTGDSAEPGRTSTLTSLRRPNSERYIPGSIEKQVLGSTSRSSRDSEVVHVGAVTVDFGPNRMPDAIV